mgnify:CR=1 FL=1
MARRGSIHDRLFQRTFRDPAAAGALLRAILPAPLTGAVDWGTLTPLSSRSVDRRLGLREGDLLFRALADGAEVLLYVLLEHQSKSDRPIARRLLSYTTGTWDVFVDRESERLPWVVPVVFHQGRSPWSAPTDLAELIQLPSDTAGLPVPSFGYVVEELRLWSAGDLLRRALPAYAALTLWALRTATDRSFAQTIGLLGHLADELVRTATGREAFESILNYLTDATDEDLVVLTTVVEELPEPSREVAMSARDRLIEIGIEQGIEQGLEQGLEQGIDKGMHGMLRKQLMLRFGDLPTWVEERLAQADRATLERLAEDLLTASTLEELF